MKLVPRPKDIDKTLCVSEEFISFLEAELIPALKTARMSGSTTLYVEKNDLRAEVIYWLRKSGWNVDTAADTLRISLPKMSYGDAMCLQMASLVVSTLLVMSLLIHCASIGNSILTQVLTGIAVTAVVGVEVCVWRWIDRLYKGN